MKPHNDKDETDPLFQRFNLEYEIQFDNEEELRTDQKGALPVDQVLDAVGEFLDHADHALVDISEQDLLGSAIVRSCQSVADAVSHLAGELERQSEEDRRALANACLQDVQEQQQQQQRQYQQRLQQQSSTSSSSSSSSQAMQEFSQMTPEDIMSALSGCSTLLRDVEAGLRSIEQDEADEIADVALTLARLFLASLQSLHSSILHKEEQKRQLESDRIEILDDDDNDEGIENEAKYQSRNNSNNNNTSPKRKQAQKQQLKRLRVLWPPLGEAVQNACQWGKEEAIKQPLLAVALGITLWPAAVLSAFVGAPLVLADSVLQHTYNTYQNGPIIGNLEQGAAQVFHAGKLSLLSGKLIGRQSLRVLNRQIERNGGVGNIAQNLVGMAVDRALHPIETVGAVWDGLHWGLGMIQENIQRLNDPERPDAVAAMMESYHSLATM